LGQGLERHHLIDDRDGRASRKRAWIAPDARSADLEGDDAQSLPCRLRT